MSSVEAAASLFGSEDSQQDLFADLGTESGPQDDFFSTVSSDPPPAQEHGLPTADSGEYVSPMSHTAGNGSGGQYDAQSRYGDQATWNSPAAGGTSQHTEPSTYPTPNGYSGYEPSSAVQQQQHSTYNPYAPGQQSSTHDSQSYGGYPSYTPQSTANSYGSYAPQHSTPAHDPYSTAAAPSPYNPYAPQAAAPVANAYAPQAAAPATNAYAPSAAVPSHSPYAPAQAQNGHANAYAPPTPSYRASSFSNAPADPYTAAVPPPSQASSLGPVPEPPKPVVPLSRPKPNAYDPPFPTASSRRNQRVVTPYDNSAYSPQVQAQPAPPVPPPPRSAYSSPVQSTVATSPPQAYAAPSYGQLSNHSQNNPNTGYASPPPMNAAPPSRGSSFDSHRSENGPYSSHAPTSNKVPAYSRPTSRAHDRYTPSPLGTSRVITTSLPEPSLSEETPAPPPHAPLQPEAEEDLEGSASFFRGEDMSDGLGIDTSIASEEMGSANDYPAAMRNHEPVEEVEEADRTLSAITPDILHTSPTVPSLSSTSGTLPGSRSASPHVPSSQYTPSVDRVSSPSGNSIYNDQSKTPAVSSEPAISNGYGPPSNRALSPALSIKSNGSQSAYRPSTYAPHNARNRSTSNGSVMSTQSMSSVNDPYAPPSRQVKRQPSEMSDYGEYSTSRYNYPVAPPPGQSPYAPPIPASHSATSSYTSPVSGGAANPYAPSGTSSGHNPYAPSVDASHPPQPQYGRSDNDMYSPSQPSTQPSFSYPSASYSMDPSPYAAPMSMHEAGPSQELTVPSVMSSQYAPSPSLLGSNDPLGRTTARIPVFSFGFGGKCVTCFHGASTLETGFDVALTSRRSTAIEIKKLNKMVEESALTSSTAVFPGPLFLDPGTPTSLVRTGLSTQTSITKAKKAKVLKYLSEREAEISAGIPYLHSDTPEHGKAEGKLVLVKLLSSMVEHDGQLTAGTQSDTIIREILVPRLKEAKTDDVNGGSFTSVADIQGLTPDFGYTSTLSSTEEALSTTVLRASALDKIQSFLLRGERRQAYHYALDQKLWAHAMVISSSIDKEAWKEAVSEFLKTELAPKHDANSAHGAAQQQSSVNGREGLRVAYSLYSGTGAAAVQELVPQNVLSKGLASGMQPIMSLTTPGTPNFPSKSTSASIPLATLSKWAETAAMMYSNPLGSEASAALTSLGDHLASNGWLEAAHSCYLLSPQSSPIGGANSPATRICLLGSAGPATNSAFHLDQDSIIFTEILEFAFSLNTSKTHEPFTGLPHLQPYRLLRATALAELGQVPQAKRYCEAISASLGRGSPYFTSTFLEQLKSFTDQVIAAPQLDKSGSWIPGKVSKPSLDTIGGWLEGRITKLIAGDGESSTEGDETARPERGADGPFKHYSTISSNAPSTSPSPAPSLPDMSATPPPRKNGPPMNPYVPHLNAIPPPTGRSTSAMDFNARKASPGPRVVSAGPGTTTFSQSGSFSQAMENMHRSNQYSPIQEAYTPTASSGPAEQEDDGTGQELSWWGQSSYSDNNFQTPTATTFMKVETSDVVTDSDGFLSLMDNTPAFTPSPSQSSFRAPVHHSQDDDDEDLGFGNSKPKSKNDNSQGSQVDSTPKAEPAKPADRPDAKPNAAAGGSSWFGRWWKKEGGPVRANLGEERSIYFDPELKKWVNKNAAAEPQKAATPPPPPSRVQTASPSVNNTVNRATPPPPRAASAVDLGSSPPTNKTVMRVRSNLVPTPESAPSTPTGMNSSLAPPLSPKGPDRPRSQASKRNIRSRYVDVFQDGQ